VNCGVKWYCVLFSCVIESLILLLLEVSRFRVLLLTLLIGSLKVSVSAVWLTKLVCEFSRIVGVVWLMMVVVDFVL